MSASDIAELRILPPFAIGRLGSSPEPLAAYRLGDADPSGYRPLIPVDTFVVDEASGEITLAPARRLQFRDARGRIKPVAPFFEVWVRLEGSSTWQPLTRDHLTSRGLSGRSVFWTVEVANIKAFRRTGAEGDKIIASAGPFNDHGVRPLDGHSCHFKSGKTLPLGSARYLQPSDSFPQIRLRFTPAPGKVYGPNPPWQDPNVVDDVYDVAKGKWPGFTDSGPLTTNPGAIYAGDSSADGSWVSRGYLDDECDGIISVHLVTGEEASAENTLSAYARIAVGPPTFAPDSVPVRTVNDELLQALLGPQVAPPEDETQAGSLIRDANEIVRRALETVRLMNTAVMNAAGQGMARMDSLDVARASEPIMDPAVVDALAIRTRHERVLLALESGTLAWFARILRHYKEVGDLSTPARRKMPAMMRGADGRHLALTRRQVSTVEAAAVEISKPAPAGADPAAGPAAPAAGSGTGAANQDLPTPGPGRVPDTLLPLNRTAQLAYQAAGNPASAHPSSAISNAFPGLEMDFRNAWRHIFAEITLHEASNIVVAADLKAPPSVQQLVKKYHLVQVEDHPITVTVRGPLEPGGENVDLPDDTGDSTMPLEWSNALAEVIRQPQTVVSCTFEKIKSKPTDPTVKVQVSLTRRPFFAGDSAVIDHALAPPGELSQSLCSPWQNDYRECACFYWAASRPDFVNVEPAPDGTSAGHNWMQKDRTAQTPKEYLIDNRRDPRLITYDDLFQNWEHHLRFQIRGQDAE